MGELLRNAWTGWLDYMESGKLVGLFLLMLLMMWLLRLGRKYQFLLWIYCAVMAVVCICPLTAALVMKYQTRFYDYEWIWTIVPMTALIACTGALILDRFWTTLPCKTWQKGLFFGGMLAVVLLCGRMGNSQWEVRDLKEEREAAAYVLEQMKGEPGEQICLWAPEEIMAHARALDSSVILVYGRNMWQKHLNAFSYDTYSQEQRDLYVWMTMAGRYGWLDVPVEAGLDLAGETPKVGTYLKGAGMVRQAVSMGVNRILLPGCMNQEAISGLETLLQKKAEKIGEYFLFRMD